MKAGGARASVQPYRSNANGTDQRKKRKNSLNLEATLASVTKINLGSVQCSNVITLSIL